MCFLDLGVCLLTILPLHVGILELGHATVVQQLFRITDFFALNRLA